MFLEEFDTVREGGIHVTSEKLVSVHALSYGYLASEAYLGYPVSMLGTEYCLVARASNSDIDGNRMRSQFAIVASEHGTEVVIQPSPTADLDKTGHQGTDPITVTLDQGETYQLRSRDKDDDVTGTFIIADKAIAVVAGARGARVPSEVYTSENPLLEQQLPVNAWPSWVLGFPLADREFSSNPGDFYRIVASRNNTLVSMNGVPVATLQAGQFWDTPQAVTVPVEFEASRPIQVARFSTGSDFGGVPGDPFELLLPSPNQYLSSYTVSAPAGQVSGQYAVHYLALIVETSELDTTYVDGLSVSQWASSQSISFVPIGNSGYSAAAIEVQEGDHVATGSKPFGLLVYGYGIEFGTYEGYGYAGGLHR